MRRNPCRNWLNRLESAVALGLLTLLVLRTGGVRAAETGGDSEAPWLGRYRGPTRADIDATTLDGKVLCGYQGWFNTPGDGTRFGFTHWGQGLDRTNGGRFVVDMWPDIYKVSNQIPVGRHFVTYEGLPSDWYLRLTGAATRMIRGETPLSEKIPENLAVPKQ